MEPAPFPKSDLELKSNDFILRYNSKELFLSINFTESKIILNAQEKYSLYYYQNELTFQDFMNLHKYFRFFDNLTEIYNDLIKNDIKIKEIDDNKKILILAFNVNINKDNYELKINLNKKELDKVKDIDIIISNYIKMKNELDEIKKKTGLNSNFNNNNIFSDSIWLKNNINLINLINKGINIRLNKNIKSSKLLYRESYDGNDNKIFHQKCDGIPNTLIIGESSNGRIFGGFTTQKWDCTDREKNDENAFIFQLNDMKIYYSNGRGGIYCGKYYGPTFGNTHYFHFCFQDGDNNREDKFKSNAKFISYQYDDNEMNKDYPLGGNNIFKLKDYEVFELLLN
jgi:hypothetical protein